MDNWERIGALVAIARDTMNRVLGENKDLRQQVTELHTQVQELETKAALLAQERTELAAWISERQREQGKIR